MAVLVWLVTGATSGIGTFLVKGIAARGDKVIATGRNAESRLADLKSPNIAVLDLDVTAPKSTLDVAMEAAVAIFGHIDVLVNNAGMSNTSPLEEATDAFVASIFDVNLFGAMKVTQAVLPHMRARRSGRIAFIGAGLGWQPFPFLGHYAMTKAALSMFAEALDKEVSPLGIRAVIFELGGFNTSLGAPRGDDAKSFGEPPAVEAYRAPFAALMQGFATEVGPQLPGDPAKVPNAVVDVVKAEGRATGRKWAVRVCLGPDAVAVVRQKCREQLELCEEWEDIAGAVVAEGWSGQVSPFMLDTCSMSKTQ